MNKAWWVSVFVGIVSAIAVMVLLGFLNQCLHC